MNAEAYAIANAVLDGQLGETGVHVHPSAFTTPREGHFILYTDGACRAGSDSSGAWVIRLLSKDGNGEWRSCRLLCGGEAFPGCKTAFGAEVAALLAGTTVLWHAVQAMPD